MKGLSLQLKFILMTSIAIVLVMSSVGYLAVEREKSILYAEVEKQGRVLGETLAIPIINDLIYERLGLVEEGGLLDNYILEIFGREDSDLLYIAILNEEGRVVSHNDITEYGKIYEDSITQNALAAKTTIVQRAPPGKYAALDFGVPLSIGKKRWGTLKFAVSLEKVELEVVATVEKIVLFTLFLLLLGLTMIVLLSRRFLKPITELANTMERAGADSLALKVPVTGHDEIALLGERFNRMMERIAQANEELRKTHEKLVQSEKLASIGILASGVAHEINNPLGGLFNCLQMLRQKGDDPEFRRRYLDLVREGLDRIENTVNKLLWMSRKTEHAPVEVNIRNSVDSVYAFVEYKLEKEKVVFNNQVPAELVINIDVHDFQQLLLNLFINAIHAMKGGGTLQVTGSRQNGAVVVTVSDTGCGIAPEHLSRIFDPFFTTKPTGEGTGLGLWLTYEIVKNYHGEISAESEVGKGSAFKAIFPMKESI